MNTVGYARVSTLEQDPALQHDALTAAGAVRVFTDYASGATAARPQLIACLDFLRPGDTLAVWRIDRLGRSVADLTTIVNDLGTRGVQFRSITEVLRGEREQRPTGGVVGLRVGLRAEQPDLAVVPALAVGVPAGRRRRGLVDVQHAAGVLDPQALLLKVRRGASGRGRPRPSHTPPDCSAAGVVA